VFAESITVSCSTLLKHRVYSRPEFAGILTDQAVTVRRSGLALHVNPSHGELRSSFSLRAGLDWQMACCTHFLT
jgi:hypothetical protein